MKLDDVRGLLASYAAGTLEGPERAEVEKALRESPGLREELKTWLIVADAARMDAMLDAQSHPGSEEIVSFAQGEGMSPGRRLDVEQHIRDCPACLKDLELTRALLSPLAPAGEPWHRKALSRLREAAAYAARSWHRPAVAIPALAAIVCAVVLLPRGGEPHPARMLLPEDLPFRTRAASANPVPAAVLEGDDTPLDITFLSRRTGPPPEFLVEIRRPDGTLFTAARRVAAGAYDGQRDSAGVRVEGRMLALEGRYLLLVYPLPGGKSGEREPLEYPFLIRKER
ncbi:MAG: hypothetical protein WB626_08535 [Bacteroidota bacterium]